MDKSLRDFIEEKITYYGATEAAYEFAAEAYATQEAHKIGPRLVHYSFCIKFRDIAVKHTGQKIQDIPEGVEVLKAIEILEELYPQLKEKE